MKSFFKELFAYNHDSNLRLIATLVQHTEQLPEKSAKLQSHVLNAHNVWNSRIQSIQPDFGVWDLHAAQDWKNMELKNHETSLLILEKFELDQVIHYTTTKGVPFSNTIRDILFHVINHSTYHRGQMASDMKQNGLDPLVTDYIFYKR